MKRYTVNEYPCRGAFSSSRYIYCHLKSTFPSKDRIGGILVFPEDMANIDTSFIVGEYHINQLLSMRYTGVDGAVFSNMSICIDVAEYNSGEMMSLAMKYARMYARPLLLKNFDDNRLFCINYH